MASLVADNPYDVTQQKFAGTGDVVGQITGGAKNGNNWDFMDQQGKVLTSIGYDDFVNNYQSDGSGAVRQGITSVQGIPVYNFSGQNAAGSAPANTSAAPVMAPSVTATGSGGSTPSTGNATAGLISGAITNPATSSMPVQAMTYTPETRQVNQPTETVQGQVNSILSKDSPLMQRARTLATQQMAQRGLVNSSMAQGAGTAAMIDRALPIAQQDANTYSATAAENMAARNRAAEFGAGQTNQFGQQENQQQFAGTQAGLDRAQQTAMQTSQQDFQAGQQIIQNDFNQRMQVLQESGMDFRQARDIASRESMQQLEQMGITNRFDQELALKSDMFNVEQYNAERRLIMQNQAEFDKLGLQIKATTSQIPANFAAQISSTAMQGVNAIMADGNLDATAKKNAIDNIVGYANAQIDWGAKFYGTSIPAIGTPTSPSRTVYNPTAPSATQPVSGSPVGLTGGPAFLNPVTR